MFICKINADYSQKLNEFILLFIDNYMGNFLDNNHLSLGYTLNNEYRCQTSNWASSVQGRTRWDTDSHLNRITRPNNINFSHQCFII